MTDKAPEFETVDLKGTTDSFSGTVGTSLIAIPTSAGNSIQNFLVICDPDQAVSNKLEVYTDGGTIKAAELYPGGAFGGMLKGGITQVHIKGNVSGVVYKVTLDREAS